MLAWPRCHAPTVHLPTARTHEHETIGTSLPWAPVSNEALHGQRSAAQCSDVRHCRGSSSLSLHLCSLKLRCLCLTAPGSAQRVAGPLLAETTRRRERHQFPGPAVTAWREARRRRRSRTPAGRADHHRPRALGWRTSIAALPGRWRAGAAPAGPASRSRCVTDITHKPLVGRRKRAQRGTLASCCNHIHSQDGRVANDN